MTTNIGDPVQATEALPDAMNAPEAPPVDVPMAPTIGRDHSGVRLSTLEDCVRYARYICDSQFCPSTKKGLMSISDAVVCIQAGAELGLSPMQAIQGIAAINGRPTIWGDAMLAVCMSSRVFDHRRFSEKSNGDGDAAYAVCECARINGPLVTRRFSVADAKKAGLWGKTGPWSNYPTRMLQMRARAFALRDTYSDILKGMHNREEAMDLEATLNMVDTAPTTPDAIRAALSTPPDKAAEPAKAEAKKGKTRTPATRDGILASIANVKISSLSVYDDVLRDNSIDESELDKLMPLTKLKELLAALQRKQLVATQAAKAPTDGAEATAPR